MREVTVYGIRVIGTTEILYVGVPYFAVSFHGQTARVEFDQVEVDEEWAHCSVRKT